MSKQSLAVKYRPQRFDDVVEQDVIKSILGEQLKNKTFKNVLLFCGGAGTGKAQPLWSKVLTPDGFITMKEVTVGTKVITGEGNIATVTEVYPQGKKDVYCITLNSKTYRAHIHVADNHLNVINVNDTDQVVTTTELITILNNEKVTHIPVYMYVYDEVTKTKSKVRLLNVSLVQPQEECKCIYVDAPEHTYITDNYVVTHNTTSARIFANEINNFKGHVIEIDAASNNSVEHMRKIIEEARTQSMDSEYKVFVLDECFHKDTLVKTPKGDVKICDLQVGDVVYTATGKSIIKNVFINNVSPERLALLKLNTGIIVTTVDHLMFTLDGWKEVKNLQKGDILIDYEELCNMWKQIPMLSKRQADDLFTELWKNLSETAFDRSEQEQATQDDNESMSCMSKDFSDISFNQFNYVWSRMFNYLQKRTWLNRETKEFVCSITHNISVSRVWKDFTGINVQKAEILFKRMCDNISQTASINKKTIDHGSCLCYMWQYIFKEYIQCCTDLFSRMYIPISFKTIFSSMFGNTTSANENKQSVKESGCSEESLTNEGTEWYPSCVDWDTWWQWALYNRADDVIFSTYGELGTGISSKNTSKDGFGISYELQNRPCLTEFTTGYRGRWEEPLVEIWIREGFKKSKFVKSVRVDSVEIYKRGSNEQLFRSYFTDNELQSDFVNMYDLEISGHSSYFVNNILCHNCHMLSNAAWNAMLKLIEEPPRKSVIVMATTDPQKIPATIISRVQRYQFQKISFEGIVGRLKYIIGEENKEEGNNITFEDSALEYIAKQADGGMRDAITLLDKAIGYSQELTIQNVLTALGSVSYETMFKLSTALDKMDSATVISVIEEIHGSGMDLKQFMKNYNYFVLDLCKYKLFKNFQYLQIPSIYENLINQYDNNSFNFFNELLNELLKLNDKLKWETLPKPLVESTLLNLCSEA